MRTLIPAVAAIVLVGFCNQANAQGRCPELTRLRSEAAALQPMRGPVISNHCEQSIRISMAWDAVVQYANDHRESCDISILSLSAVATDEIAACRLHT